MISLNQPTPIVLMLACKKVDRIQRWLAETNHSVLLVNEHVVKRPVAATSWRIAMHSRCLPA